MSDSEEAAGCTVTNNYIIVSPWAIRWGTQMTCGVEYVAWDERFELMGTLGYIVTRRTMSNEYTSMPRTTYNVNDPSCLTHTLVNP